MCSVVLDTLNEDRVILEVLHVGVARWELGPSNDIVQCFVSTMLFFFLCFVGFCSCGRSNGLVLFDWWSSSLLWFFWVFYGGDWG